MRVLVVAATLMEIRGFQDFLAKARLKIHVECLITGIGITNTAYTLTKRLTEQNYDLVINVGIAGSFDKSIKLGTVACVSQDCFADLGVWNQYDKLQNTQDLSWTDEISFWSNPKKKLRDIPNIPAITVNAASGSPRAIEIMRTKYPDAILESMEGAAVFMVCKKEGIVAVQIRAISNYMEPRDLTKWQTELAVKNLTEYLGQFICDLKPDADL